METILDGVGGLKARLHKTDDVWFLYLDAPKMGYNDTQLTFKTKTLAKEFFNKLNNIYKNK